eukprot:PhF_6_TR30185/c0_g2_i1/m.44330
MSHQDRQLSTARVICPHCKKSLDEKHISLCSMRPVQCNQCKHTFTAYDFLEHRKTAGSCKPKDKVQCVFCKGWELESLLPAHFGRCARRPVKCKHCGDEMVLSVLVIHVKGCRIRASSSVVVQQQGEVLLEHQEKAKLNAAASPHALPEAPSSITVEEHTMSVPKTQIAAAGEATVVPPVQNWTMEDIEEMVAPEDRVRARAATVPPEYSQPQQSDASTPTTVAQPPPPPPQPVLEEDVQAVVTRAKRLEVDDKAAVIAWIHSLVPWSQEVVKNDTLLSGLSNGILLCELVGLKPNGASGNNKGSPKSLNAFAARDNICRFLDTVVRRSGLTSGDLFDVTDLIQNDGVAGMANVNGGNEHNVVSGLRNVMRVWPLS